jgi:myosin heavy subunit
VLHSQADMERTRHAMKIVGMDKGEIDALLRVIAGIMHCGNIKFGSCFHAAVILMGLKRFNRAACLRVWLCRLVVVLLTQYV